jgi:hypothetical protein
MTIPKKLRKKAIWIGGSSAERYRTAVCMAEKASVEATISVTPRLVAEAFIQPEGDDWPGGTPLSGYMAAELAGSWDNGKQLKVKKATQNHDKRARLRYTRTP